VSERWTRCEDDLPDADQTVMIYDPDEPEPVWVGYLDGETWRTAEGSRAAVTYWMPMPIGPIL
jgi:Protein of unknown function (DUF551)